VVASKRVAKDVLIELYVNRRKTLKEVCECTGIKSPITLAKYMDEYGIKRRDVNKENSLIHKLKMTKEEFKKLLINLYSEEKMSINEISEKFNTTPTVVRRRLIEFDIPLRGHKASAKLYSGEKNHLWNGGRRRHNEGYVQIKMPEHPNADGCGYIYEHRHVMEKHLGRFLERHEHVHHINEIKDDNRLENLQVLTNSEHARLHSRKRAKQRRNEK
jgi:predicted HTH domain antitoxin